MNSDPCTPAGISRPPRGKRRGTTPATPASRGRAGGTNPADMEARWRWWHKRYVQLNPCLELLDALDNGDQVAAARAAREIEAMTGLRITLPSNRPSRRSDAP